MYTQFHYVLIQCEVIANSAVNITGGGALMLYDFEYKDVRFIKLGLLQYTIVALALIQAGV